MNSRAGKVGDYNKSQRWGGVASLLNAVDHSDGPDFFPIDTCDNWPLLLSWSHNTSCRTHGFKEHLVYIHPAEMKLQLFAQVLSGVSEEGGVGGWGRQDYCTHTHTPVFQAVEKESENCSPLANPTCPSLVTTPPSLSPNQQAPCFFPQKVRGQVFKTATEGSLFFAMTFSGILSVGYQVSVFTL